jgi:hypothetical protein
MREDHGAGHIGRFTFRTTYSGKRHTGITVANPERRNNRCEIVKENIRASCEHLGRQVARLPLTADFDTHRDVRRGT